MSTMNDETPTTPSNQNTNPAEPSVDDLLATRGPMTSRFADSPSTMNRAARRAAKKKGIGPRVVARQTAERIEESKRARRVRELPDDVKDLLDKITTPEVLDRTKGIELHAWDRADALNLFYTLALVHARMVEPIPADEDSPVPPAVRVIQAGDGVGVFYPVTDDSTSHVLVTVNDPRHYLTGADRDLTDDAALDTLNGLAERIIMGVYSLSMSLIPGSDAHEIAELLGTLNEMEAKPEDDEENDVVDATPETPDRV